MRICSIQAFRKMRCQSVVKQCIELVFFAAVEEVFKMPEAQMAGAGADHHRSLFRLLPENGFCAAEETQTS